MAANPLLTSPAIVESAPHTPPPSPGPPSPTARIPSPPQQTLQSGSVFYRANTQHQCEAYPLRGASSVLQGGRRGNSGPLFYSIRPLNPTSEWLFPPRDAEGVDGGDVLSHPFSPEEVIQQFCRMKNTVPGVDGLTYATWRLVDPKGLILALVFNICHLNSRVPSACKHSTVTLIHKGGEHSELRNWRPISLQLNITSCMRSSSPGMSVLGPWRHHPSPPHRRASSPMMGAPSTTSCCARC